MRKDTNQTLTSLIEQSLMRGNDALAIVENRKKYTYSQLNKITLHVMGLLNDIGNTKAPIILLMTNRLLSIIGAVAILRSGRCLVPVDSSISNVGLKKLVNQFDDAAILTDSDIEQELFLSTDERVALVIFKEISDDIYSDRPQFVNVVGPEDIAYIMTTSGSTGEPKLVSVSHYSIVHYVQWQIQEIGILASDRFGHLAPVSFDFSFKEWLVPLVGGGIIVVGPVEIKFNPKLLSQWVNQHKITVLCCIPFVFRQLANALLYENNTHHFKKSLESLRLIMISGERLPSDVVLRWQTHLGAFPLLMNLYGPTESVVIKLFYRIPFPYEGKTDSVPLGQPINSTKVEIVDEKLHSLKNGSVGQIILISDTLGEGYYRDPGRTATKFIKHRKKTLRNEKILLTGDYGYIDHESNIVFCGRMDSQVKRLGVRIELDELTAVFLSLEAIEDAAVVVFNEPATIAAFVVLRQGATREQTEAEFREIIRPNHFPDQIYFVERLPKLSTGKTNLNLLKSQSADAFDTGGMFSESSIQIQLTSIWKIVLQRDDIFPDSDFFEHGGDSAKLMEVLGRIRAFNIPSLNAFDIFGNPTIKGLCNIIKSRSSLN